MTTTKQLYRSNNDKIICGVSAGMAEYFDVDPSLVRLAWIVLVCVTMGVAIVGYAVLCLVLPLEDDVVTALSNTYTTASPRKGQREGDDVSNDDLTDEARVLLEVRRELGPEYEDELVDSFANKVEESLNARRAKSRVEREGSRQQLRNRRFLPSICLGIGAVFLLASFGAFSWFSWVVLCSLAVIGAGVALLLRRAFN